MAMTLSERYRSSALARLAGMAGLLVLVVTAVAAQAQNFQLLHTFAGSPDGMTPYAGLTRDSAGNLYDTTFRGGADGCGMVFKLAHKGSGWTETLLHSFACGTDGESPYAPVVIGPDGNLYGTTQYGGVSQNGIVFKLSPPP